MSVMALETAEPSSTQAGFDSRSGPGGLLHEPTGAYLSTAAERQSPVCHASRCKRRRVAASVASPTRTNRKRFCRFDDGASAMNYSRYSRRPSTAGAESARHARPLDQDGGWPSRRHAHQKRRPHCAIGTEYLGVSSAAFAPPLTRYLESPKHGRRALRSTCTTTSIAPHSPPAGSSRCAAGGPPAVTATTTPEHVGRRISGDAEERDRRARLRGQEYSASSSTDQSGDRHALFVDAADAGSLDGLFGLRAKQPPKRCASLGLLTPVGPDWWETASEDQAPSRKHPASQAGGNDAVDSGNSLDQQLLRKEEERHPIDDAVGSGEESCSRPSSQQGPPGNGGRGAEKCEPASRNEGYPPRSPVRGGSRRRRRVLRSSAWDLLTGRRMERGRRKGSCDIRVSDVSSV